MPRRQTPGPLPSEAENFAAALILSERLGRQWKRREDSYSCQNDAGRLALLGGKPVGNNRASPAPRRARVPAMRINSGMVSVVVFIRMLQRIALN